MEFTNVIGLLAGALTTSSFFPQIVKTWKTRSVQDVSLEMYVVLSAGLSLWTVYGFLVHSLPVILTNVLTLALALSILVLKIKHEPAPRRRGRRPR